MRDYQSTFFIQYLWIGWLQYRDIFYFCTRFKLKGGFCFYYFLLYRFRIHLNMCYCVVSEVFFYFVTHGTLLLLEDNNFARLCCHLFPSCNFLFSTDFIFVFYWKSRLRLLMETIFVTCYYYFFLKPEGIKFWVYF